ncbi:MAG: phage holin family protein, partial [Pseudomonadota bacterium]|nr:phage holin family protein [Pseudomonadota bacterium]
MSSVGGEGQPASSSPQSITTRSAAEPSLTDLVRNLVGDVGHLFRTELRLAKTEVVGGLKSAVGGIVMIGIGVVLLLGALFTLLGAFVGWLTPYVGAGWAALIVAVVAGGIGGALALVGSKRVSATVLMPGRT